MSVLNDAAFRNNPLISVTPDTSHVPMGAGEQRPIAEFKRHESIAVFRSTLVVNVGTADDMHV
jgi:hypothetical protein